RLTGGGECRVTALAAPFRTSLPAISRHLRVLERARLIHRQRSGREHLIRVNPTGLHAARKWMAQLAVHWDFSFDTLDGLLKSDPFFETRTESRKRRSHELRSEYE